MKRNGERKPVRTLIVDDERLARKRLRRLLEERDEVEIVGESHDGRQAVDVIIKQAPDLVFLDIQMPDLDGFGVLEEIGCDCMPAVIFVTAYDEYALKAFAVSAIDYLLKPFDGNRFAKALDRALVRLREQESDAWRQQLTDLLGERSPKSLKRIVVRRGERLLFVPVAEIDWLEAEGAYVRLHVGQGSHLVRESLKNLEQSLDAECFVRIHRSTMVRIDQVLELRPLFHGEYEVKLRTGARVKLSRSYRDGLQRLMGG